MHTHFLNYFFFWKKYIILCILKGKLPFKMHKIIFFPENLKKILGFTSKFRQGRVTLNAGVFYLALPKLLFICSFCVKKEKRTKTNLII